MKMNRAHATHIGDGQFVFTHREQRLPLTRTQKELVAFDVQTVNDENGLLGRATKRRSRAF